MIDHRSGALTGGEPRTLYQTPGSGQGRAEPLKARHHFRLDIPHNHEAKALGLTMGDPYH